LEDPGKVLGEWEERPRNASALSAGTRRRRSVVCPAVRWSAPNV